MNLAKLDPKTLEKYDFVVIDEAIEGAAEFVQAHKKAILSTNNTHIPSKNETNEINGYMVAEKWMRTTGYDNTTYIIGAKLAGQKLLSAHTENLQLATHVFATHENFDKIMIEYDAKACYVDDRAQLLHNIAHKQLMLCSTSAHENSLSQKVLALGGWVQFFHKPWPMFYAYLFNLLQTRNVLMIEHANDAALGAKMNGLDCVVIG